MAIPSLSATAVDVTMLLLLRASSAFFIVFFVALFVIDAIVQLLLAFDLVLLGCCDFELC